MKESQKYFIKAYKFLTTPIFLFLFLLIIIFSIGSPYFFSSKNFINILSQSTSIGLLAIGLGFVIMNGNIDLSVGSTLGLCSAVFVITYNSTHSIFTATVATLLTGFTIGLINGLVVWLFRLDSFIATLASMIGVKGILFVITKENSIGLDGSVLTDWGSQSFANIPIVAWFYLILTITMWFVQKSTIHGHNVLYVGGNKRAAKDAGINMSLHQVVNFTLCSVFVAIAAILLTSQLGSSTPNTGKGYELWAITAVALGGIKLIGGVGTIPLIFLGGITIGLLRNGMNLLHVSSSYIYLITGLVLLAVLILEKYLNKIVAFCNQYPFLKKTTKRDI